MTRLTYDLGYGSACRDYMEEFIRSQTDFSNRIPSKRIDTKQRSHMGGAYGYTFLGLDYMVLDNSLFGEFKKEVDVHESIHNEWEYQTDILAKEIVSNKPGKYLMLSMKEKLKDGPYSHHGQHQSLSGEQPSDTQVSLR